MWLVLGVALQRRAQTIRADKTEFTLRRRPFLHTTRVLNYKDVLVIFSLTLTRQFYRFISPSALWASSWGRFRPNRLSERGEPEPHWCQVAVVSFVLPWRSGLAPVNQWPSVVSGTLWAEVSEECQRWCGTPVGLEAGVALTPPTLTGGVRDRLLPAGGDRALTVFKKTPK